MGRGLSEEDHLDWLENSRRSRHDVRNTDALLFVACIGLASALVAGIWMIRCK